MAKENKNAEGGGNVIQMNTSCIVEKCTKKADRMNFCSEHYTWFKEGLINKKGERPSDFDKKFHDFSLRHKKAA